MGGESQENGWVTQHFVNSIDLHIHICIYGHMIILVEIKMFNTIDMATIIIIIVVKYDSYNQLFVCRITNSSFYERE